MGTSYELRDARIKNKRIAAQIIAINTLHSEVDGRCVCCDVAAPCPTRTVSRAARRLVTGDDGPRMDARTAGETAVARYLKTAGPATALDDYAVLTELLADAGLAIVESESAAEPEGADR